ncbi:MAG: DUF6676 family protein, partial [Acidimicrobiia bacterium]
MRKFFALILTVACLLLIMAPVLAQTPSDVADIVAIQGYYVEPGAEPVNEAELQELVAVMQERGLNYVAVVLAEDPQGGANAFAGAIVDEFSVGSTVVVLSPSELGFASTEFSTAELNAAGQNSIDLFSSNVNDGFTLFADHLSPGVAAGDAPDAAGGGGGGFPWALLLIVGGLV